MPELPEVENLRRGLEKVLRGRRIGAASVRKPRLVAGKGNIRKATALKTAKFIAGVRGARISAVSRIAKNLIFHLDTGGVLVAHLKMSGQFAYRPLRGGAVLGGHPIALSESKLPNKHTHIILTLDAGELYYNDPRMFGYVLWYPSEAAARKEHFSDLGLEPFDAAFTPDYLYAALRNKGARLKAVLLAQDVVTGLGNIYADEVCFAAQVRPDRIARTITLKEAKRIHAAIGRILRRAIQLGGSSVATYRLLDLTRGNYAREHKVYGRVGKPCVVCKTPLSKMLIQSRTTVFCKRCEK